MFKIFNTNIVNAKTTRITPTIKKNLFSFSFIINKLHYVQNSVFYCFERLLRDSRLTYLYKVSPNTRSQISKPTINAIRLLFVASNIGDFCTQTINTL